VKQAVDIFVFADALGWKLAEKRRVLADLLPYRSSCDTLAGYSCTCDPSILTGALPDEHGHFSFYYFSPRSSPFGWARRLAWLPEPLAAHHRVRNLLSRRCARALGITGYFQLYSVPFGRLPWLDYSEKRDIYEPGGILGGQETIFEVWKRSGRPWMRSDWRRPDEENVHELGRHLDEGNIELAYLFTSRLDAVMHAHGCEGPAVDAAFARFEGWIRDLARRAAVKYREVRIHLFSDHGMADTRRVSRMMPEFEALGLRYGRDYAAVWDSTMVRFWFPGGAAVRGRIESWLSGRDEGGVLSEALLRQWRCFFPDGRYGELFYLLKPGTIFAPSYMNRGFVRGMHGFSPEDPDSAACWLTSHPVQEPPRRIEQIHGVMRRSCQCAG